MTATSALADTNRQKTTGYDASPKAESLGTPAVGETWSVVSGDARLRVPAGGGVYRSTRRRIPRLSRVRIEQVGGDYVRVSNAADGSALGWTAASNLAVFFKNRPALQTVNLAPATPIPLSGLNRRERAMATTYNRLGGLLDLVAAELGLPASVVLGIWYVESGSRAQLANQAILRFENHVFFRRWGRHHTVQYDTHFQHGGRAPQAGHRASRRHFYRVADSGVWTRLHAAGVAFSERQRREYEAKDLAARLAGEETALLCVSYGGPQIMGFNHLTCAYPTARQMYRAFQGGERAQVLGFADFMAWRGSDRTRGFMLRLARGRRWAAFGRAYNGSSRYGATLQAATTDAEVVLRTLPAGAHSRYGVPLALFQHGARIAGSEAQPFDHQDAADTQVPGAEVAQRTNRCADSVMEAARREAFLRIQRAYLHLNGTHPHHGEQWQREGLRLARRLISSRVPDIDYVTDRLSRMMSALSTCNRIMRGPETSACNLYSAYYSSGDRKIHLCNRFFNRPTTNEQRIRTLIHESAHAIGIGRSGQESYLPVFDCQTSLNDLSAADAWAHFIHCVLGLPPDQPDTVTGSAPGGGQALASAQGAAQCLVRTGRRGRGFVQRDQTRYPGRIHAAQDIPGPRGTPVYAATDGVVIFSGRRRGYGNLVLIRHEGTQPVTTAYAHLDSRGVALGDSVTGGTQIGTMGNTTSDDDGDSGRVRGGMGVHLHFSVQRLPSDLTNEQIANLFSSRYEERRDIRLEPLPWLRAQGTELFCEVWRPQAALSHGIGR
jgi:hypothetical protein